MVRREAVNRNQGSGVRDHVFSLRRGMTLIELLVVIVILMMITAVAIPVMAPNTQQRQLRESARMVNAFLGGARSRAIESGKAVGVRFEPMESNRYASMVLTYVEEPQPYGGEVVDATVKLVITSFNNDPADPIVFFDLIFPAWQFSTAMLKVGDFIKIRHHNWEFPVESPDVNNDGEIDAPGAGVNLLTVTSSYKLPPSTLPNAVFPFAIPPGPSDPPENWSGELDNQQYAALLQVSRSLGAPLQLPEGYVVDLRWSGEGATGTIDVVRQKKMPTLLFQPDGTVRNIMNFDIGSYAGGKRSPLGPLHFLIGRAEKAQPTGDPTDKDGYFYNYQDPANYWVSIGNYTGIVGTTEVVNWNDRNNNGVRDATGDPLTHETVLTGSASTWGGDGFNSRGIASSFQSMGGR